MGLLALFWGSSFLWIKIGLASFSPVQMTLVRVALGAAVLVVLCYSSRQRLPKDRRIWGHLVIGVVAGGERGLSGVRLAGLLLGFCGTLLIFAPWEASDLASWGALIILAAAMSYAVSFAYIGRFLSGRGTAPIALSAAQILTATGLTTLALPLGGLAPMR